MALEAATIATITAIGSAAAAGGQAIYSYEASQASSRAERLRQQQMQLDALRKRREVLRQSIVAQSMANARANMAGVGPGSSAIGGAYGQNVSQAGRDIAFINASERIGGGIFGANRDIAQAQSYASVFNQAGTFANVGLRYSKEISDLTKTLFGTAAPEATGRTPINPTGSYTPPSPWYSNTGGD